MKIRLGVAMPLKGGRPSVIAVEVRARRDQQTNKMLHYYHVGAVERVTPYSVEATSERILKMVGAVREHLPCVLIDVGSPQGLALYQKMRVGYPRELHRPHAYPGHGLLRPELYSNFLLPYAAERVSFEPGLDARSALDRALVFYMAGGVDKSGIELSSEDESLVMALGLAMTWPNHGPRADPWEES